MKNVIMERNIFMVVFDEGKQKKNLKEIYDKEQENLAQILSKKYGATYIDLSNVSLDYDALYLVDEEESRKAMIALFKKKGNTLHVAARSPGNDQTKYAIAELERKGYAIALYMVSANSLERAWSGYEIQNYAAEKSGVIDISDVTIQKIESDIENLKKLQEYIDSITKSSERTKTSHLLEVIFGGALAIKASDVHIEPEEGTTRLRLRIDGILQDLCFFDEKSYKLLVSRIKLISGLKLNVRDKAQDGRFGFNVSDREIGVRTSIIPGAYGESVVMRLLDPNNIKTGFKELGINKRLLGTIETEIHKPNGLILNTGPTGSGKTTSLYAFLNRVYTPEMKIITIENPIEYHLEGIVQTQVDHKRGYTFLEGLRSALRQDPDIIMVGEIRDFETAQTAINSALTGHLVLSTLHTNNAAGTIPRLIDIGVNNKIISSALTLALAQRLVRKLCEVCREEETQTDVERETINNVLLGIKIDPPENHGKIWRSKGCDACNNTGFKGRVPVIEGIHMDKKIEDIIQTNPSEREIAAAAQDQGALTMSQDGIIKILEGTTTLKEVQRVVDVVDMS